MAIVVQKYGGSSVATAEKIKKIADTLIKRKSKGDKLVVVVSAMGDTTDDLINLAKEISPNPDKRELDALLSTGEMMSSALLAMALKEKGVDAVSYTAYQIGLETTGNYGKSLIKDINDKKIKEALNKDKIVIVAGFQGVNEEGNITTLGRGGSDTTAVAIAVKLNGISEIYTDVDGIYNCDPRKYVKAKKIPQIDYEEILELASLGAQVMHSRSIELAQKYNIPIYVGLANGEMNGTLITEVVNMETKPITGIATSDEDVAITLEGLDAKMNIISRLFGTIAERKISIDMISQSAPVNGMVTVSFTIPKDDLNECMDILKKAIDAKHIFIDTDITKLSMVGIGMKNTSGVAAKVFQIFAEENISVKMITTSEIRITCAIYQADKERAIKLIVEKFNL
ncbi:aspartate kinase [Clostridium cellulovorans]|uniref:Aspartokinase n=1 Tax=Clostridium cellulovorans (strain ATCC 35296 / DSM 3052 / OCM 3 / 743B) TaxID=573061 RepID=D9SRN8_CLOC7|nr:aspartate kinase [Clostridium cellulovorans]ADL50405.1 aspartate kinase [Clostridium cellulovorans 743B]